MKNQSNTKAILTKAILDEKKDLVLKILRGNPLPLPTRPTLSDAANKHPVVQSNLIAEIQKRTESVKTDHQIALK